jgi:phage shock protein PspC (stress-responsive transcriptional regulator)
MTNEQPKRLYRNTSNKILAGVCSGLGDYFSIDPVIIRLLWVVLTIFGGAGLLIYIIAWIIIPEKPIQS